MTDELTSIVRILSLNILSRWNAYKEHFYYKVYVGMDRLLIQVLNHQTLFNLLAIVN